MPDQHAPPALKRIAVTAVLFALAVISGELTFGNPGFPLNVWYFVKIPAWQWSLPVHLTGFIWLVACHQLFRTRPALVPILLATLFFFIGETLNWYFLNFFAYAGDRAGEKALSFWAVIAMYAGLCAGAILILRAPAGRPADIG
jgi:hypothetical protein